MKSSSKSNENQLGRKPLALKQEAESIAKILGEAQECLKVMEYLVKGDPALDVYNRHADSFWSFTAWVFANQVLLDLHILLDREEHYGIPKLLNKLKPGGELKGVIEKEQIDIWEKRIAKMQTTYQRIAIRRNKQIAHRDRNFDATQAEHIKIRELQEIVLLAQEIVKEIYMVTMQSDYLIGQPINAPIDGLKKVMHALNEGQRNFFRPLFDQAKAYGLEDELPASERKQQE